jgi:hypothetical protein
MGLLGAAMIRCNSGLTSVGTGMVFAGTRKDGNVSSSFTDPFFSCCPQLFPLELCSTLALACTTRFHDADRGVGRDNAGEPEVGFFEQGAILRLAAFLASG